MSTSAEIVTAYIRRGLAPVPVRGKKPIAGDGWQNLRLTVADVPRYFTNGENIGIILGEPSGNLTDADLDCPEAVAAAAYLLPETRSVFGRASRRRSHWEYTSPAAKTEKFVDPRRRKDGEDAAMLVELRSTGGQTVFPGSVHETGELIEWEPEAEKARPQYVAAPDLRAAVARVAAAALLGRYWPAHARHDAALALVGTLLRAGWQAPDAERFVEAVARAAGDEEPRDRIRAVADTAAKLARREEVTGLPSLAKIMGEDLTATVRGWLGIRAEAPAPTVTASAWRSADVLTLLTAEPLPIPFLADRLLARQELALLTAQPKDGKTWLVLGLAVDLALGRPALGLFATPGPLRVLLADEEMGYGKLQRRLQRLVKGAGLSDAELAVLAENMNLRPQQGMTFTTDEGIAALVAAVTEFRPDVLILDSFAAYTSGIDDTNPVRRQFYTRALAPLKQAHNLAVLMTAHPPLPAKEQHADARKRPRGGGDILAVADRALYVEKVSEEMTEHGRTVTVTLGELFSREAGGLDGLCTVTIEDTAPDATAVRATSGEAGGLAAVLGKLNACQREILHVLRQQPDGKLYQPTLTAHCEAQGFDRSKVYYPALNGLEALKRLRVLPAIAGSGKSGKWVQLTEDDDD